MLEFLLRLLLGKHKFELLRWSTTMMGEWLTNVLILSCCQNPLICVESLAILEVGAH